MTEDSQDMILFQPGPEALLPALQAGNQLSARYGLALSARDMQALVQRQSRALRDTQRVEFGPGPYEKLIYAFCDSPFLGQAGYADTLGELCELFYHFKGESGEGWSDDELIEQMAALYNGSCQGSLELMADWLWQGIHPVDDGGDDADDEEEPFEE